MTEEEAKEKWCPFARIAGAGAFPSGRQFVDNRILGSLEDDPPGLRTNCIASACMAWRREGGFGSDGYYCGLAGNP